MMVNNPILAGFYIVILMLIIVYDLRYRRILNLLALPATALAILLAYRQGLQPLYLTILGASVGFIFFYALFLLGRWLYKSPALGFGDVKLAMLIGAMVGLQGVFSTLALGMLLAGAAALALFIKRGKRQPGATIPYGAFMSLAGIFILIWNNFL